MTTHEGIPWAPEDATNLTAFPLRRLRAELPVWRVHLSEYGPWHFGHGGRFGIPSPYGTCYVALTALTAIAETVIRGQKIVMQDDLALWKIRHAVLPRDIPSADFTSRRAAGFGVTRDFCTEFPYDRTQSWAAKLNEIAFEGIHYWARHDLGQKAKSVALFGKEGERVSWKRGPGVLLSEDLWAKRIKRDLGVMVEAAAPADQDLVFERPRT